MTTQATCPDCNKSFAKYATANRVRCVKCASDRVKALSAAQRQAWDAIRSGSLVRQPCEVCGALKVDAHHDDYSRPLAVRWLCRSHHQLHHYSERRAQSAA